MQMLSLPRVGLALGLGLTTVPVAGQDNANLPSTADRPMHQESALPHEEPPSPPIEPAALPTGMTLDEVLEYAEHEPPERFPDPVVDDKLKYFVLFEQLEYRIEPSDAPNNLGWENQAWIGFDYDKFWLKNEGEVVFEGPDEGETETDLLYSRLITPFWNLQVGAQYANEWESGDYDDRWSGVIALQGLAPYKFELDNSLYISEDGDVTFELEAEYDFRITQRLVLQPRAELGFAAQHIPERMLGAGMTDASLDLRLRYEVKREIAPYIGVRYHFLTGETADFAEAAGQDTEAFYILTGVRLAF